MEKTVPQKGWDARAAAVLLHEFAGGVLDNVDPARPVCGGAFSGGKDFSVSF
jgi:hypothetical protein